MSSSSLQSLQKAQRDTTNFAVNKETLGTFVPRHQGTCHIIPSKPERNDGLDMESRTPPWKALFIYMKFSPQTRANPPLQILTCLHEVGGVVLPSRRFSLTYYVFAAPLLLSLIYTDREPGTAYCRPQSKIQNPTLQFDLD